MRVSLLLVVVSATTVSAQGKLGKLCKLWSFTSHHGSIGQRSKVRGQGCALRASRAVKVHPKEYVSIVLLINSNTVLYCIVLYRIVLYCIVLYCIVLYCIVLYCIVLYCIVL